MNEPSRRRVRRSRAEWQNLINEQAAGQLSQVAFCQTKGLSLTSFQYWKRRLVRPEPEGTWLDLSRLTDRHTGPGWEIELALGDGLCLRLRRC